MKKIISEKNFAAILFVLVLITFSFAHEDTKKRDVLYNASAEPAPPVISAVNSPLPDQLDKQDEITAPPHQ